MPPVRRRSSVKPRPKPAGSTPEGSPRGLLDSGSVDLRKLRDEFKRPIDDAVGLVNEFAHNHNNVPTVLLVAQAEAVQESLQRLTMRAGALQLEHDAMAAREALSAADKRALTELGHEKRRVESEVEKKRKMFAARRDLVLSRANAEYVAATTSYARSYDDLRKPRTEAEAHARIVGLCEQYSPERLAEREEPPPRQPADLGDPTHARTLLALTDRAIVAMRGGERSPLGRLASAAAFKADIATRGSQDNLSGQGCTWEMGPLKGFPRSLRKAEVRAQPESTGRGRERERKSERERPFCPSLPCLHRSLSLRDPPHTLALSSSLVALSRRLPHSLPRTGGLRRRLPSDQ